MALPLPRAGRHAAQVLLTACALVGTLPSAAAAADEPVSGREVLVRPAGGGELERIPLRAGLDPHVVAEELRSRPDLFASAGANIEARAAATAPRWAPDDATEGVPWSDLQWNFDSRYGVRAPRAWEQLRELGARRSGGRRVRIAVVDSGIAYRDAGPYRRSDDVDPARVLRGWDFVDDDRFPDDRSGHGTHVAATIAAPTGDGKGLTGLAYEADLVPVRVLDEDDVGDVLTIARGIRYAIRRGVDLINLSADFPPSTRAREIPEVMSAVRAARRAGILVVSSSGNDGLDRVALPARSSSVLAVGATTVTGCRAAFSNGGRGLALSAPGGGDDLAEGRSSRCTPGTPGQPIRQVTLMRPGATRDLGIPSDFVGTSMAAAHVTGVAALVLGSGLLGPDPTPDVLAAYLQRSVRDLGPRGRDDDYGAGLLDAARATSSARAGRTARAARRDAGDARRGSGARRASLPLP